MWGINAIPCSPIVAENVERIHRKMLYRTFGFVTFNSLAIVLSILMILAIPLGVLRLVFSIGNWKTRMGFLPRFRAYDEEQYSSWRAQGRGTYAGVKKPWQ